MVTIAEKDLESLYQQGIRGNAAGFTLIGRQVVSKLKKSQPEFATRLAELLATDGGVRNAPRIASPVDADSRRSLLKEDTHVVLESEPTWESSIESQLLDVIIERENFKELIEAGLEPIKSMIFTGPPGVGKTLAANWLASKLNLPILTLDLATVMSSLLGKTGSNIKAVIDHAKTLPCILLLDEFDAIAKRRDDDKDVGELKRLVNVLLQAIDEWPSTSILIAATNHPDMLDPAVWRRFELAIRFNTPPAAIINTLLDNAKIAPLVSKELSRVLFGKSFSDINRILTIAKKKAVLTQRDLNETIIEIALNSVTEEKPQNTRNIQIIQLSLQGMSQRKIAAELSVSHPTVGKIIKEYKESHNG
ncbi:AAA family ATPase [Pseudomonas fluorescens]|uniref:AAA family ATPase n=1 Tax=Pseudomonas fluorescens TaxID=294 RepID=UPI001903B9D9|nr:AAA family ATPase [Pseudomonas fluorescens]MBD8091476.1 AAA family ATPase [Pseudomonas fluorescens]MBD8716906.1 AAA family ATPase [Pseudomonas fluorescens]